MKEDRDPSSASYEIRHQVGRDQLTSRGHHERCSLTCVPLVSGLYMAWRRAQNKYGWCCGKATLQRGEGHATDDDYINNKMMTTYNFV